MTFRATIYPSSHEIEIEERETILRAGMRQGLNLPHSCMNGSCGECQARLIDGQVEKVRFHDYRMDPAQEQAGWFLSCCHRAVSDLSLEMRELNTPQEIPLQQIDAKVAKLDQLQDEVMQLHIRTPRSKVLDFLAGQRAHLCLEDGTCLELGIASCPCDGMNLRFHLRHRGNEFCEKVFSQLKKGKKILVTGPDGQFTLDESSSRPLVFIAWETGFAQISSVIDHVISFDPDREIRLFWMSAIPRGHYLSNHCRAWCDALDNFSYHSIDLQPDREMTFADAMQMLIEEMDSLDGYDVYATLPAAELEYARNELYNSGLPPKQFFFERLEN